MKSYVVDIYQNRLPEKNLLEICNIRLLEERVVNKAKISHCIWSVVKFYEYEDDHAISRDEFSLITIKLCFPRL